MSEWLFWDSLSLSLKSFLLLIDWWKKLFCFSFLSFPRFDFGIKIWLIECKMYFKSNFQYISGTWRWRTPMMCSPDLENWKLSKHICSRDVCTISCYNQFLEAIRCKEIGDATTLLSHRKCMGRILSYVLWTV